jgi:hypothetical protein
MYALKSAWETAVFESIALNEIACIIIVDLLLRQGAIARGSCRSFIDLCVHKRLLTFALTLSKLTS